MFSTIPAAVLLKRSTVHETNLGEQDGIEEGHFDQLVQLQLHFEFVLFLLHYESHTAVQYGCSRGWMCYRYISSRITLVLSWSPASNVSRSIHPHLSD